MVNNALEIVKNKIEYNNTAIAVKNIKSLCYEITVTYYKH